MQEFYYSLWSFTNQTRPVEIQDLEDIRDVIYGSCTLAPVDELSAFAQMECF